MKKNEIKNSSDMFLYKALVDFNSAKCLLANFDNEEVEIDVDKIYFDLQQCVEKLFKSLLTHHNVIFKKTHDIENLISKCSENNIDLILKIEILIDLTDFAVEGRYSIICDDLNDMDTYMTMIIQFIDFLKKEKGI